MRSKPLRDLVRRYECPRGYLPWPTGEGIATEYWVYAIVDLKKEVLYVGESKNVAQRITQHLGTKGWDNYKILILEGGLDFITVTIFEEIWIKHLKLKGVKMRNVQHNRVGKLKNLLVRDIISEYNSFLRMLKTYKRPNVNRRRNADKLAYFKKKSRDGRVVFPCPDGEGAWCCRNILKAI